MALLAPAVAKAQVMPCQDNPNVVYVMAGDTQRSLVQSLGKQLRADPTFPMTLAYKLTGSCTNIAAMYSGTKLNENLGFIPADPAFDPNTTAPPQCSVPAGGVNVDVANSIVFLDACTTTATPSTVQVERGPVQAFVFAVPEASTQTAITAEEAYFVFGFGQMGMAEPWVNELLDFIRPVTKGTIISMGASIKVPPARWKGVRVDQSSAVLSMLAASTDPERSIAILGNDIYDPARNMVNALAFKAFGQKYAYWPDSTANAFDKRNVRDGHYHMWSYTQWMYKKDAFGNPASFAAKRLVDAIVGQPISGVPFNFQPLDTVIATNEIPICAMKVQRSTEGGDLSAYHSPNPCGCYYESKVTGAAPAGCRACTGNAQCGIEENCSFGFCEGA